MFCQIVTIIRQQEKCPDLSKPAENVGQRFKCSEYCTKLMKIDVIDFPTFLSFFHPVIYLLFFSNCLFCFHLTY